MYISIDEIVEHALKRGRGVQLLTGITNYFTSEDADNLRLAIKNFGDNCKLIDRYNNVRYYGNETCNFFALFDECSDCPYGKKAWHL